ncbi:UNVERIFIED_CONTAM: hypothetical protein B566_EDAN017581 [Ephemera danica]|nr:hypothetical protein B566_EDAN017581 [Ephemera danica]
MFRLRRVVNLDHNATTPLAPDVLRVMNTVLKKHPGNPSSLYRAAQDAAHFLDEARQTLSRTINAKPHEIIFTGSASEANNQILRSCVKNRPAGRTTIIASPLEHPSVIEVLHDLSQNGIAVRYLPVDTKGRVDLSTLNAWLDDSVFLVTCMMANNEIGVVQDIVTITALIYASNARGAWLMVDAVQALGKLPLDVAALGIDFASFSAHKIRGPKGVGALYVRTGVPLSPFILGGHQENGLRAGTEATHNITGFAAACRRLPQNAADFSRHAQAIARRRDQLAAGLLALMPTAQIHSFIGDEVAQGLCTTLSVSLPGFEASEAIAFLDYQGISVAAGSACNTHANAPSHVLKALGLSDELARQTLRFSLSEDISATDIRYVLKVMRAYIERRNVPVRLLKPSQVGESLLFASDVFILDVRYNYDRKLLKSLPNAHETSNGKLKEEWHLIPRHKHILVACQAGTDGPLVAYFLRAQGFRHISFIMGGMVAWKLFQSELYRAYAGHNTRPLLC